MTTIYINTWMLNIRMYVYIVRERESSRSEKRKRLHRKKN